MRFEINNAIIFDDEQMILFFHNFNDSKQIRLGSIHSRCLSHLFKRYLENRSIIYKKELFFACWEKHGLISSNNNLAQTIFQIRKTLKHFKLENLILTIPRVGFKLKTVDIKLLIEKPINEKMAGKMLSYEAGFLKTGIKTSKLRFSLNILIYSLFAVAGIIPCILFTSFYSYSNL